ncbi:hypothetical protein EI94DRAFT_1711668, partial [Lactarius quietus]
ARVNSAGSTWLVLLALKCLYKSEIVQARVKKQIHREIKIQQNLRHPNVLCLYGYFHDEKCIFLMLEFLLLTRGKLYKQLTRYSSFSEQRSAIYIDQMADALSSSSSSWLISSTIARTQCTYPFISSRWSCAASALPGQFGFG